ncbi:BspA family leucine-rich repeat surface protein [Ichthyobacterium seriolicida]|uniref:BspA family leucine-rich repeat surface protein n=1 Tax=Ichthyobacterium seriolicida TaxID=242600 RepID=UPI0012FE452D|nr:BspA family leucine-rich repeat surface protein [Ichthyobacterium seriolicida]
MTDLSEMFYKARDFNGDISNWNVVSKVENMSGMFCNAEAFNKKLNTWDVSSVTNMYRMFSPGWTGASIPFNQDISGWDVRKVTNCNGLSTNASNFEDKKNLLSLVVTLN